MDTCVSTSNSTWNTAANCSKFYQILEEMCEMVSTKAVEPYLLVNDLNDPDFEPDFVCPCSLEGEDRIKARAAWRHYLSRLGVTWNYSKYPNNVQHAPEGHVAFADFMTDKGSTTLFVPNHIVENALLTGSLPNQEDIPRKKSSPNGANRTQGEQIMRAVRNTTEYVNLVQVEPTADDKRIVFKFANETSFNWCVYDFKFYHGDTGTEFGESHFKNIIWGLETDRSGQLVSIKPGYEKFFLSLEAKSKEGWVKNFFKILSKWINERVESQRRSGSYKLYQRKMNKLETLCNADIIGPVESLAKNNFVNQMNLDRVCQSVFKGSKIISFKEMREDNLDAWFFQHVSERAHPQYLRDENPYNNNADIYEGDENREYILGNYMENYRIFNKGGLGDLFRYVWENYKYAFTIQEYYFGRFKESINRLSGYGYDHKRLMDYLFRDMPNQGISQHMRGSSFYGLDILSDYARMSVEMDREFDKYPRYLKTAHDIANKNYRVNKSKVLSDKYDKVKESLKKMEYKGEEYCILVPENLESIVREGSSLNHCVASYIEGVVAGDYAILFLRSNKEQDKSLVTVQVKDGRVLQARGQSNRPTNEEEAKFLEKFVESMNKQKEMVLEEAA